MLPLHYTSEWKIKDENWNCESQDLCQATCRHKQNFSFLCNKSNTAWRLKMKNTFYIFITLIVLFAFVACSNKTNNKTAFQATVLEVHDNYYLVKPAEGSTELNSADQITVSVTGIDISPKPKVGDIVEIVYDGLIAESYPAQITNVYSIQVIK